MNKKIAADFECFYVSIEITIEKESQRSFQAGSGWSPGPIISMIYVMYDIVVLDS